MLLLSNAWVTVVAATSVYSINKISCLDQGGETEVSSIKTLGFTTTPT